MRHLGVALLCGTLALSAYGQNAVKSPDASKHPSSEDMKLMMESSMGAMAPMMGKMSEAMIEAQLSAAEKPETARRIAQFKKNLYDELLKQGFSKDRAFAILLNTPLPAASPGQR